MGDRASLITFSQQVRVKVPLTAHRTCSGWRSSAFQMTGADRRCWRCRPLHSRWSRSVRASSPRIVPHEWIPMRALKYE